MAVAARQEQGEQAVAQGRQAQVAQVEQTGHLGVAVHPVTVELQEQAARREVLGHQENQVVVVHQGLVVILAQVEHREIVAVVELVALPEVVVQGEPQVQVG